MIFFAFATLCPIFLVIAAVFWGGVMPWIALGYVTVLVFAIDRLVAVEAKNAPEGAEFPAAAGLLIVLGAAHLVLLPLAVWAIAGDSGLGLVERALIGIAAGLIFGQISHPVAHELIHRPGRGARRLGRVIYASLFVGHHASAHLRVHHPHVGTDADPNSPRRGRGFYRYALRAMVGSFRAGLREENRLMRQAGHPMWRHPYLLYLVVPTILILLAGATLGMVGAAVYLGLAGYAHMQILMSDYVQHYGLRRKILATGKPEPVGPQHSWNAPHWYSSAMMVNAPRHSDHHTTPSRPYPSLKLDPDAMPMLPLPLPMMATIALVPPLWRRIMDPRVARWA